MLHLARENSLSMTLVFISCVTAIRWTDLAKFSDISTSYALTEGGSNNTCQVTDSTNSSYDRPLLNATPVECRPGNVSGLPVVAIPAYGNIILGNENCTHTTNMFRGDSWTISFWAKYNGNQSRTLFEVRSNSTTLVSINTSYYQAGMNSGQMNLQSDAWTFIVLRMTVQKAIYLDINGTNKFVGVLSNIQSDIQILFGPQTNISAYVQIVDARIYRHCLTGREITKLSSGTLAPKLDLQDNCLCPRDAPTVLPGQHNYGIFCIDHNNNSVYRLNNYTHPAEYAVDDDETTYWNSGTTKSTNITLDLKNVFQLSAIEINFLFDASPSELVLTLIYKGKVSKHDIHSLSCKLSGGNFTYSIMNGTDLTNRTNYSTLLADKVNIQLNGNCNNETFYAISAIKITGSCHCSGNSENCIMVNVTDRKYSCVCTNTSNMVGNNCETCSNGFWRNSTFDLNCQNLCSCNLTERFNSSCNEIDGQCYYQSNVASLSRDQCEHDSYNFSSNGCIKCKCNPDGITVCNSTGQCVCKPNVETESGTCESCMPKYCGFRDPSRCIECGCNATGSKNLACNETSGQSDCKAFVTGRTCDKCKEEYWNLDETNANGCVQCECNTVVGSINNTCEKLSGQCPCHDDVVTSRKCDPVLTGTKMTPTFGPIAGGTYVTLSGQQLGNQEVNVTVYLRSVPANIIARNSTTIIFKTMKSSIGSAEVKITWHKWKNEDQRYEEYKFPNTLKFDYRQNAFIQEPISNLQSFSSGWCNIELKGSALDIVNRPEIILYGIGGAPNITVTCSATNGGTSILCKPPNVSYWVTNGTYSYGVVLDGITDFLNMSTSVIEIQPDPTFVTKGEIIYRNVFDKLITVRGEGFSRACNKRDFRVHLSHRGDCEIKDFTDTEIKCDPRETFPGTGEKEALTIYIGAFEKDIGIVEFLTFWKLEEFIYICVGVGGLVLIAIATIIVCCICRQRYRRNRTAEDVIKLEQMGKSDQERTRDEYVEVESRIYRPANLVSSYSELFMKRLPDNVASLVETSIIDKSHIVLGEICPGKGTYTRIINGKYASSLSTSYAGDGNTIKTLVENYPAEGEIPTWLSLGLEECTRLRDVVHDKVLRLHGIAIDETRIYVIYPPTEGTLKDYIQKTYGSQVINIDDVIGFCFDVGEGMMELHRRGIVHKDLAARNCVVDSEKVAKVADAAFALDLYPEEYIKQQMIDLPVRWMAVESLQQIGFYDKATDMVVICFISLGHQWSYGVLLWEVFTGCHYLPYHDLPNNQIYVNVVMQGYRLGKPENIPQAYLDIFDRCMDTDSNLRPTFEEVLSFMNKALENPGEVIYQNQEEKYVNKSAIDQSHYMNKSAIDQAVQSDQPAPPPRKRIL